ncbi:MAG TPA: YgiT-type zinc finger domain-containing protein [Methanothrix sp.]|nr:YgiT-type zinc finger domain-containing protein [Methanothrix sp.]HRW83211.1 YgiT-type zinc finger domain-containing protein [Methanothrix sp.]
MRGGAHTAVLKVRAEICLRCGERLYSKETIRRFEEIRAKLKRQETAEFKPMGLSFEVV